MASFSKKHTTWGQRIGAIPLPFACLMRVSESKLSLEGVPRRWEFIKLPLLRAVTEINCAPEPSVGKQSDREDLGRQKPPESEEDASGPEITSQSLNHIHP